MQSKHPAYDLAHDDELWSKREILEDAYFHAYKRRFGVAPTPLEAFNVSYQTQILQMMMNAKFGSFQDGLEGRLDKLQFELQKFIDDNVPLEEDEGFGNR